MPKLLLALSLLASFFLVSQPAQAQSGVQILLPHVEYTFGEQAVFKAQLQMDSPPEAVYLSYQSQGKGVQIQKIIPGADQALTYTLDLHDGTLRPFAKVTYWFTVKPVNADPYDSPKYSFSYEDNRFTWQTLEKGLFHIHWVEGDLAFGQEAENVAEQGLTAIQNLIPLESPVDPFEIYLYPHAKDLQVSLEIGGEPWVAGHASPDLGVVLVSIPIGPEQELNMEQQIPHELAHIMLYQKTGEKYASIPVWLSEGFASLAELYPNADYSRALDVARQNQSLLPMASLCLAFPRDASGAFLAYAQSASFTRFIQQNYGSSGLNRLVQSYMDGLGCSEGAMTALGVSLSSLDTRWEQEVLGINVQAAAWQKLSPYLSLFGLLLVFTLAPGFFLARRGKEKTAS
jgi:hypothetical protein